MAVTCTIRCAWALQKRAWPCPVLCQGAAYLSGLLVRTGEAAGNEAAIAELAAELKEFTPRGESVQYPAALAALKAHAPKKLSA